MENPPEDCTRCGGVRFIFIEVDTDHRSQYTCPGCGGTGNQVNNAERLLNGEAQRSEEFFAFMEKTDEGDIE